jgi:hypothetical protein
VPYGRTAMPPGNDRRRKFTIMNIMRISRIAAKLKCPV